MSKPFAIWTMRRTGGTTLTDLLMSLSDYPKVEHEPFNEDRIFGEISRDWYQNKDERRTRRLLEEAFRDRPLIKHCFEIHGQGLNQILLDILEDFGYRQILLDREDQVARVLSLQLAEATGVWGKMGSESRYAQFRREGASELFFDIPTAVTHLENCFRLWAWLDREMEARCIVPHRLRFEDLYADLDGGIETVKSLFSYVEFSREVFDENRKDIVHALSNKGQRSGDMMPLVKNIDAARKALQDRYASLREQKANM